MNKLEVGMYIRFNYHRVTVPIQISKIKEKHYEDIERYYYLTDNGLVISEAQILKASFDIIDLIEEGDILLLFDKEYGKEYKAEVVVVNENFTAVVNYEQNNLLILEYELITNAHIELLKILTKEQFESMSYRIGE